MFEATWNPTYFYFRSFAPEDVREDVCNPTRVEYDHSVCCLVCGGEGCDRCGYSGEPFANRHFNHVAYDRQEIAASWAASLEREAGLTYKTWYFNRESHIQACEWFGIPTSSTPEDLQVHAAFAEMVDDRYDDDLTVEVI